MVNNVYGVNSVDYNTFTHLASRISGSEKTMQGSVMHVTLAGQQHQSLRYCFNMTTHTFKMTSGLEPESLQLSSQYPREVCTIFKMLQEIQKREPVQFHKV